MLKFVLATHNKNKVKEMESILGRMLSGISDSSDVEFCVLTAEDVGMIDEIEENGSTFEENARIKASALAASDRFAVADDSGLEVVQLGGAPAYIQRDIPEEETVRITRSCSPSLKKFSPKSVQRGLSR